MPWSLSTVGDQMIDDDWIGVLKYRRALGTTYNSSCHKIQSKIEKKFSSPTRNHFEQAAQNTEHFSENVNHIYSNDIRLFRLKSITVSKSLMISLKDKIFSFRFQHSRVVYF